MRKIILGLLLSLVLIDAIQAETVFVSLEKDNSLALVDPVAGKLVSVAPVGRRPRGIAVSPDNKRIFVATSDDNTIKIIDSETLKTTGTLPSGKDPETFAVSPDGSKLYVSNEDDSMVTVIDVAKKKAIKQIKVGVEPEGIAISLMAIGWPVRRRPRIWCIGLMPKPTGLLITR